MIKKLKERWGIKSNFQIVIIFIVFGITGSVSAYFSGPLTEIIIGSNSELHWSIKLLIRILVLTPIYKYYSYSLDIYFFSTSSSSTLLKNF